MPNARTAVVYPCNAREGNGFAWKWRYKDSARSSGTVFTYFHECADDARKHGCDIEVDTSSAQSPIDGVPLAPPGSPHV